MSADSFNRHDGKPTNASRTTWAAVGIRRHAPSTRLRPATGANGFLLLNVPLPYCRVCGCTEINACPGAFGGCYWVEPGLCSACAPDDHPGLIRIKGGIVR